ncbi:MAG: type II toxin-antitoxin system prevent-host-death family antitoxin [Nitrosopumilus sp.]|nr:type II toxin-antitoxin system prevent-host-death family antitoxin [Nitrosopumilus sp.]
MMQYWPLQDAKAQLSKLIRTTLSQGPQGISVHGEEQVVILPKDLYDQLTGTNQSFLDLISHSPLNGIDLTIDRNTSMAREIDL